MKQQIGIIDYGMGNLKSVFKAFEVCGANCKIVNTPEDILKMDKIVFPGVGAIRDCMKNLRKLNLIETINEFVKSGKYLLGICLGMQALFEESSEFGLTKGLGLIKGKVIKFENIGKLPVPHMGWNSVIIKKQTPILKRIKDGDFFYFAHSYYVKPDSLDNIMTETEYGIIFTSSVQKDNIFGLQFHPEKSQKKGLIIIENYINL